MSSAKEFQFHKGTIKTRNWKNFLRKQRNFNSIKVRLKLSFPLVLLVASYFNSIKVRLKPVKSKAYTPEDSIGLRVQRYKKIFRKMSMPKDIFSAALRQPAYLWRFQ